MAIQFKRGTEDEWLASSFMLAPGQPGTAIDTGDTRIGTGSTLWRNLPSVGNAAVARALGWKIAEDFGLDTTGATVHTAAQVQTWLDAGTAYAKGTLTVSGGVIIRNDARLAGLAYNYTGTTGTAIQIGEPGSVLWRKRVELPSLVATAKTAAGWAQVAGTVGVKIVNANSCSISGTRICNFETGLLAYGAQGTGCVYNHIQVNHLDNNKIQQDIAADATGWSNENQYRIARFSFNTSEGAIVPGTRCIRIQTAPSIPNNNIWVGGSVEANTPEYHVECAGGDSRFLAMRWENGSVGARVWWRTGAFRNIIDGGYDAHRITETYESGSPQTVLTGQGWKVRQSAAKGVLQVENYNSSATSVITIMGAGAGAAGTDPATGYAATLSANLWALKRPTDTFDRLQLDAVNSRIYFGSGAAALTRYLSNLGTSGISVNGGNWCPGTDNTLDLGIGTFRWRDFNLGRNADIGGTLKVTGNVGFYGATPAAKPAVTGSRGGNAALASLLTSLAGLGLITDSTTA